jgi:hypothetical protein
MANCPYCAHEFEGGARVCKKCGRALIQRCLACAEDIPVLSQVCPMCKSPQNVPIPAPPALVPQAPAPMPQYGAPVGEQRNIVLTLVLWFFTCGIYGLIVMYQIATELNAHRRRNDLSPGVDILLGILTCGIWWIFAVYKYAEMLREISAEEGGPVQDVTTICLVLELLKYFGCPGIISVLVLQNELNTHWARHRSVS